MWKKILEQGVLSDFPYDIKKVVMLVNQYAFISSLLVALFSLVYLFFGYYYQSLACLGVSSLFALSIYLNRRYYYSVSRFIFLGNANIAILLFSFLIGQDSGILAFYFPVLVGSVVFFHQEEKTKIFFALIFTVVCFLFSHYFVSQPLSTLSDFFKNLIYHLNIFTAGFLAVYAIYYLVVINNKVENVAYRYIEESLKESEELYRKLIETSPDGICLIDRDGKIVYISEKTLSLFGYIPNEQKNILGKNIINWIDPRDHLKIIKNIQKILIGEEVNHKVYSFLKKDGSRFIGELNSAATTDQRGNFKQIIFIIRDITERKKTEEELKETLKKLKEEKQRAEKNIQLKEEFLSHISHEIRTPIGIITGLTELLLKETLEPKQKEMIKSIRFTSENLLSLINDILDLSKIDAGKIVFESIPFNIRETINKMIESIQFKIKEKNLTLFLEIEEKVPQIICGDPYRLNQILLNFLSNAIKFTHQGKIEVKIAVAEKNDHVVRLFFEVSDTGIGIAEDKIQTLFQDFHQTEQHITRKYGGTGLGLTICKKLIEMQKGIVWVKSKLKKGTSFFFEIPFLLPTQEKQKERVVDKQITEIPKKENLKILLIEDNAFNQMIISEMLKNFLFHITVFNNGVDALQSLEKQQPDIILTDLHLPDMDGFEIAKKIRSKISSQIQQIPIIAITADISQETKQKAIQSGIQEILLKPFPPEELYKKIQNCLHNSSNTLEEENKYLQNFKQKTKIEDPAIIRKICRIYIKQTKNFLKNIEKYSKTEEWDKIKEEFHKIKPSFNYLGFYHIVDLINELAEKKITNNREKIKQEWEQHFPPISKEIKQSIIQVKKMINY